MMEAPVDLVSGKDLFLIGGVLQMSFLVRNMEGPKDLSTLPPGL
jgi:hypothetical protein